LGDPRGIRSAADLAGASPDVLNANDPARLDGKPNHISCSVEYPNHWNLKQFKGRELRFPDWVVLIVDPSVLWRASTYFSPRNAAASSAMHVTGLAGFNSLYPAQVRGAYGKVRVRAPKMLPCCPTDDQAEALVERSIARELIRAVAVVSDEQAKLEQSRLDLLPGILQLPWLVVPAFFTGDWSNAVRQGNRPPERVFEATS
jgi:hypothetical protein